MPVFMPSSLDVILPFVVNKLLADGVFAGPNLCYLADDDTDPYYPPADRYCVIVAKDAVPWDGAEIGGGRQATIMDQTVSVCIWQRNASDVAGNSTQILTNQATGVLALVHQMIDSLQEYFVRDELLNVYTVEGMRVQSQDQAKRVKGNEEWIRRRTLFHLIYQANLAYLNPPV